MPGFRASRERPPCGSRSLCGGGHSFAFDVSFSMSDDKINIAILFKILFESIFLLARIVGSLKCEPKIGFPSPRNAPGRGKDYENGHGGDPKCQQGRDRSILSDLSKIAVSSEFSAVLSRHRSICTKT